MLKYNFIWYQINFFRKNIFQSISKGKLFCHCWRMYVAEKRCWFYSHLVACTLLKECDYQTHPHIILFHHFKVQSNLKFYFSCFLSTSFDDIFILLQASGDFVRGWNGKESSIWTSYMHQTQLFQLLPKTFQKIFYTFSNFDLFSFVKIKFTLTIYRIRFYQCF